MNNLPNLSMDTVVSRHFQLSVKLLEMDNLSLLQRVWLLEILSFQVMGGELPYLSIQAFAKKHKVGRNTISSNIEDLIGRNILWKYKQQDEGLACQYQINPEFLKWLGYKPEGKKQVDIVFEVSDDEDYINQELAMYDNDDVESPF